MSCGARIGPLLLLLVLLNAEGDGFHLARSPARDQLFLLPITLLFCTLLFLLLRAQPLHPGRSRNLLAGLARGRVLVACAIASLAAASGLLLVESHYYASFGYQLHPWAAAPVFSGSILLLGLHVLPARRRNDAALLGAVLLSYAAVTCLSIASFPLAVQRSDMLPLLAAAGRSLLDGTNPYHLYTFPSETVFLSYLPGTLLAYLPAVLLHVDLRCINLLCGLALAVLLYRAASPAHRFQVTALIAVWLLSPYLLYRHEIYTAPHWLALTASLLLLARRRLFASAVCFGISIALSQFSWVLFPFYLLYLVQRHGRTPATRSAAVALLTAAIIVVPFLLRAPHAFLFGVLSHWQHQAVSARPINLSYWLAAAVGASHLQQAQTVVLAIVFLSCARRGCCQTFAGCLGSMSVALSAFILLNILVWGYFFLLLEMLLLLYVFVANGWLKGEPPAAVT